jgi:two-component system phosphate regulon sensor histidine kinase PhoR
MSWTWLRPLLAWVACAGGAAIGYGLGAWVGHPVWMAAAGVSGVVLMLGTHDAVHAHRFIRWLRGPRTVALGDAPGLWSEVFFRAERKLKALEHDLLQEREQRSQFLSAIEASPNGVLLLDESDQIEWCNRVAAEHFGLDVHRDILQRITNLVRVPAFVAYLQGGTWTEPVVVEGRDAASSLSVLVRRYGQDRKIVLSMDITERQRGEAMRRDFVANVSHEIRTPLTVLAGFIETMENLPLTETERQRVLLLMRQQTDRMHVLVADLLTLAQLEGSPRPSLDRWNRLSPLLQRIEADGCTLSAGRHTLAFPADLPVEVAGVEAEILSAVGNLVNNAVRYTPAGGRIEVSWVDHGAGYAALEVRDNGIGIAREHLPRLTERFYRVDGSRSRETGGTGLGLAIVKHVMQRHGGELEVESEPGKGSCFRLVFPSARVRPTTAVQAVPNTFDDRAITR